MGDTGGFISAQKRRLMVTFQDPSLFSFSDPEWEVKTCRESGFVSDIFSAGSSWTHESLSTLYG